MNKRKLDSVSLADWLSFHTSEDERREVFVNMDKALKYIHEHGYCIEVFYPTEIEILDDRVDHIRFNALVPLSFNESERRTMINEDIFRSSLIQIGIYSGGLKYLTPDFLKSNFKDFVQFLPVGDVPYYRGIIERGATVYLSDYANEKVNRDLNDLENQLGEAGGRDNSSGKALTKTGGFRVGIEPISNDSINDSIYKQINGLKDSAFVSLLIIPTIILISMVIIGIICWCLSLI